MPRNPLGPIKRARDAAGAPGEKGAKKKKINGIIPSQYRCEERHFEPAHPKHLSDVVRPGWDHLRRQGAFAT